MRSPAVDMRVPFLTWLEIRMITVMGLNLRPL
jgi:hypothetical protein